MLECEHINILMKPHTINGFMTYDFICMTCRKRLTKEELRKRIENVRISN